MSDFWTTSDNEPLPQNGSFETGGGDIEPIPAKTQVLAAIDEAKWDDFEGEEYISFRWNVFAPAEYKNRKVFQKVRVRDMEQKKRDKAIKMLTAIDANCGGNLMKTGERPTSEDMTRHLCNKPMMLLLQVWKLEKEDGTTAQGNWVSAVSPKLGKEPEQQAQQQPAATGSVEFDDDIPF